MDILQELQRSQLQISPVTSRAIDKYGLGNITFREAFLKYPDSLELRFTVKSSQGRGNETHFTGNGSQIGFLGGYRVRIQFENFGKIAPSNFLSLSLSQQVIYLKEIFDRADIRVGCDCGCSYWQGTQELLDRNPPDASFQPFIGVYGKGIWDKIHNTDNRICKHVYHVLEELDYYIPKILKSLNKNTSISSSTAQNSSLQAPTQPAGIPNQSKSGIKKTSTINTEKAEPTVKEDIEEIKSSAETLDLPNMNISDVKSKSHENESDAISGSEKAEPPIEEITIKRNNKKEDMDKELPEIFHECLLKRLKEIEQEALKEIEIKSPKDFKLWKEWYSSDAYLYMTFEDFKLKKKFKQTTSTTKNKK